MKAKALIYFGLTGLLGLSACTKLDENSYDQLISDEFYSNKNEIISAVLRPYTHANAWATPAGQDNWWRPSELSADQLAWPTKGRHGEDGGKWKRLHYHTWFVDEGGLNNAWNLMYWGVGLCNDPIEKIEPREAADLGMTQEEKDAYIAELKLFRAFHYLKLMDLFGSIPVVTVAAKSPEAELPNSSTRKEVFEFVEKEILDNVTKAPLLSQAMRGRMSQAAGYAMLVELYLNAEVWTGTARWDDCVAAADKLISGQAGGMNGAMALDPNLTNSYTTQNYTKTKEAIFEIAYNYTRANFPPSWPAEFFHFKQREIYGGGFNGNDGIVVVPGVYTSFKDNDLRKKEWMLEGPMVKWEDGTPVTGSEEYTGKQLVFVDNIRRNSQGGTASTMSDGEENSGVRFNKYKLGNQQPGLVNGVVIPKDENYANVDWNIYRLTWIYFAKAEALMRKAGGTATADAVALINACRQRSFSAADWPANQYTTSTLTMDELLAERGREFIFEGFRRDDLIRFKKFSTANWWDHQPTTAFREIFPVPQQQRSLNPKLVQNPGYN
ncbi:MAG: RagB/SusD family nutrient uptake outer membrane protein [Mucilaginibacter polytrichastri]|nr:RagB/SusD family nutrient uptake outer membrane protein [Mucilaginibacter polytrichastri]